MPCPKCRADNAQSAKFCSECGTALSNGPADVGAERRQLTVLLVDLVGSTSLSESMDPEELSEFYSEYHERCTAAIQRHQGHIAQYLGDGILTYFGYPTAHEDDALRAVRSGLEILRSVEHIIVHGVRPHVRIGVHTGQIVMGDVAGGAQGQRLALGETPHVAAGVQSEAQPGTVLISEATKRLVADHFALEDLGSRTLKGITRPTQLFRVLGTSGASSPS